VDNKEVDMADNNNGSVGWALASFLLGSIFGAALALILTPETGQEAREKIRKTLEKSMGTVSKQAEKILDIKRKKGAGEEGAEEEETQS